MQFGNNSREALAQEAKHGHVLTDILDSQSIDSLALVYDTARHVSVNGAEKQFSLSRGHIKGNFFIHFDCLLF